MPADHKILPDERELFARIAAGDAVAFELVYHHYNQFLEPFLFNKTRSRELAEEFIQEIWLKLWERRGTLPGIQNYRSYIFSMAVNLVYANFKKATTEQRIYKVLLEGMASQGNMTDDVMEFKESEALINEAVEKLTPRQRDIYLLSRRNGLSHDEIAEKLNISKRSVSNQVSEALKLIKQHLGKAASAVMLFFYR